MSDVVTRTVTVVLPEPLQADAGDDLVAIAGEPVTLDGGGTRPLVGVEGYRWDFGDGDVGDDAVATHTYAQPGTYTAKLTADARARRPTATTATVTVLAAGRARSACSSTVTRGGAPLARRRRARRDRPTARASAAVTDAPAHARLRGLPDGELQGARLRAGATSRAARPSTVADGRHGRGHDRPRGRARWPRPRSRRTG